MTDKIKIGLIGLGDCTLKRFFPQLAKEGSFEIAKAADVDLEHGKLSTVQAVSGNVQAYLLPPGATELPEEFFDGLDIVYIASPHSAIGSPYGFHFTQTLQSLKHRIFTVTEKPLVKDERELSELEKIVKSERVSDLLFAQDHYLLKPTSMYAMKHFPEWIEKYGKIESIDGFFLEVGNLQGLEREHWLIDRDKGGGLLIDTGVHLFSIITKIAGAKVTRCDEAVAIDMFPEVGFKGETGFYGRLTAEGDNIVPSESPNIIVRVAKGYRTDNKSMVLHLEKADITLDYASGDYKVIVKPKDAEGQSIQLTKDYPHEYRTLAEMVRNSLTKGEKPFLTIDDAGKSLRSVFMCYDRLGGSNMKLVSDKKVIDGLLEYHTVGGRK